MQFAIVTDLVMKKELNKEYTGKELAYLSKLISNGINEIRARWYLEAMQTWTSEDSRNYDNFQMAMMGQRH